MTEAKRDVKAAGNHTCPQCGTAFTCAVAEGQSQCWCFKLPHIIALDESDDKGCLCPACLGAKIEQRLSEQQAT